MKSVKKGGVKAKSVTVGSVIIAVVMGLTFGAVMPSVLAKTVQPTPQTITSYGQDFDVNYNNITIWLDGTKSSAIVGQELQFYNATGEASGKVTLTGLSENNAGEIKYSDTKGRFSTSGMKTGDYNVTAEPDAVGCNATVVSLGETKMELKLKSGTTTIDEVTQGTQITVKFTSSLDDNDGVILKVIDPNGDTIKVNPDDNTIFGDSDSNQVVNVYYVANMKMETSGWELGTWKFKVCTETDYACGLDKESNEVELEIKSPELKIEAKKTEVVVSEKVKLTVDGGIRDHNISIFVEKGAEHAWFPASINDNPSSLTNGNFTDKIGAEGKMEYVVYFDKIGSYTVTVRDLDSETEYSVDLAVSKKKVTFSMPETCAIGADLVVNGTANTGKTVDIAIDDVIVKVNAAIDNDGAFEAKLATPDTPGTGAEDAIKIKAFIDGVFSLGEDVSGIDDDGSVMVLLVTGSLTADSSVSLVSPGDSFTLSGTALGPKVVDILIVAPKDGGGNGMNPTNSAENGLPRGVIYETATVSGSTNTWSSDIDVHEDADTGMYLAFVLTPGKNQIYDEIETADLLTGIADNYLGGDLSKLGAKTQEQIKDVLLDASTEAAGSDDLMKVVKLNVGKAEVALYSLADVVIGDDLEIAGTSNREGHTIILKVTGPMSLETKFATVTDGKFSATFSTSEALTGGYTVEADDGEGHTDTKTVNIITPVRTETTPTPAPTSTPTTTTSPPVPESTPTAQPQTMEATENSSTSDANSLELPVPGFEAVTVIAALLIVCSVVFVARKRRV
jgi:hypothetical protein